MTLLSLLLALLLEQFRPLQAQRYLYGPLAVCGRFFENHLNDGQARHGAIAWALIVLPAVVASALLYALLVELHALAAFAFNVGVLYLTMGFRHVSHFYTRIHAALRSGDLERARAMIGHWRGHLHDRASAEEVARLTIEEGLVGAHRQVFALILCFILLPGPSGAVLYRLSHFFANHWGRRNDPEFGEFGRFARHAFDVIEWLPARVTAMAFSIVGDFEDAAYCWRTQAPTWPDRAEGVLLAAGAGALGVRLGLPIHESGELVTRPELGTGDVADVDYLQSTVGLVRRTLVLFFLLIVVVAVSGWAG